MNVAKKIIDKCGGVKIVAKWVNITEKSVYFWTYDKSHGGRGGIIPAKYHETLLIKARQNNIQLTPEDFFQPRK